MAHPRLIPGLLDESDWDVVDAWLEEGWGSRDFSDNEWNSDFGDDDCCGEEEVPIPLTQRTAIGGCAAKWRPGEFASITQGIAPAFSQEALQGFAEGDDCIIMHINDEQAAVFTLDWLPAIVDNPYEFGAISAAAALGKLYASGVKPITALNIMALPCKLGVDEVGDVMRGGSDKVIEAGAFVVGGHSIDDGDPKYGLAVFGIAPANQIIRNEHVVAGDVLLYTKPLGSGIMNEAFKSGLETEETLRPVIDSMMELNKAAAEAMSELRVHGAVCVSAFGLVGHLHALLESCGASATLDWEQIPLFDRVWLHCCNGVRPERTASTVEWAKQFVDQGAADDETYGNRMAVLCDAQTSGGVLIAVHADEVEAYCAAFKDACGRAPARIGIVTEGSVGAIRLL